MKLSEIRISLCNGSGASRLRAFCSLTFDETFVIRDVKLIEGPGGLFVAMPSRKLCDHCRRCGEKNHLRAKFCNQCGSRLNESRVSSYPGAVPGRLKLHADIAHPINADARNRIEREVLDAYSEELERSRQPGYVPQSLDDADFEEECHGRAAPHRSVVSDRHFQTQSPIPFRATGTA